MSNAEKHSDWIEAFAAAGTIVSVRSDYPYSGQTRVTLSEPLDMKGSPSVFDIQADGLTAHGHGHGGVGAGRTVTLPKIERLGR